MPLPKLRGQVGLKYGTVQVANHWEDQQDVAELLRQIPVAQGGCMEAWKLTPLISDKVCGRDLAKGIKDFQLFWRDKKKIRVVDGIVDPGGTSLNLMYALATKTPPPPGPVVPHGGVLPTPADFAKVTFEPPIFAGVGVKISLADPIILGTIGSVLKIMGVHIPHGCDIVLVGMNRISSMQASGISILSGVLIGVTPRRGVGKFSVSKLIAMAKGAKVHPKILQLLQGLQTGLEDLPSSMALGIGLVGVAAKGFDSTREMHGYRSTAGDEASFSFAIGGNVSKVIGTLLNLAELIKGGMGADGWKLLDIGSKLSTSHTKAIVGYDIPAFSLGVDVGFSVGTATWYAFDIDGFLAKWKEIQGDFLRRKSANP